MSIKRYCDLCEQEMIPVLGLGFNALGRMTATVERKGVRMQVEVIQSVNGGANVGDVCKYCILDALQTLDDRPRPS